MNGSAVKVQRRELRRAFGPEAVASLGEGSAKIQHIDEGLAQLAQALELQRQAILALTEIRNRSFLGRLRWLVTGR